MTRVRYLLDTNILVALCRGGSIGNKIRQDFSLQNKSQGTLISIVSHGEIRSLAKNNRWGRTKLQVMENMLSNSATVVLQHPDVINAYVEIDHYAQTYPKGALNMGKNDLWIAACAVAANATLLTLDKDFLPLPQSLVSYEWIDQEAFRN